MEITIQMNRAIDYMEAHLLEKLDWTEVAKCAYLSRYHFERMFGMFFGITPSEYVRRRRLSIAAEKLVRGGKVIDIALDCGYETPEGFTRAFVRNYGFSPSKLRHGYIVSPFHRFYLEIFEGLPMQFTIEQKSEQTLIGFRTHFEGTPYGERRNAQEEQFFCATRAGQWLLIGASSNPATDYCIVTNADENGYDFLIAYELDEWTQNAIFDLEITGIDCKKVLGLEKIIIPETTYAVFRTEKGKNPLPAYSEFRRRIAASWPTGEYQMTNAPELTLLHWRPKGEWDNERYIELRIPVEKRHL